MNKVQLIALEFGIQMLTRIGISLYAAFLILLESRGNGFFFNLFNSVFPVESYTEAFCQASLPQQYSEALSQYLKICLGLGNK